MAGSDRCYFFGCCSDRRSPQINNNVELVELKRHCFQAIRDIKSPHTP